MTTIRKKKNNNNKRKQNRKRTSTITKKLADCNYLKAKKKEIFQSVTHYINEN